MLLPREAPWAVPLPVLARLAGGFPIRRALFEESWDFVAYLAHVARLTFGVAGFWLVLLLAPALVAGARPHRWAVAVALALVLVAWGLAYSQVLLWVMGATPLERPELEERLGAIAERSTAPSPRLWVVGPRGGAGPTPSRSPPPRRRRWSSPAPSSRRSTRTRWRRSSPTSRPTSSTSTPGA